jgi:hypothetical protein
MMAESGEPGEGAGHVCALFGLVVGMVVSMDILMPWNPVHCDAPMVVSTQEASDSRPEECLEVLTVVVVNGRKCLYSRVVVRKEKNEGNR